MDAAEYIEANRKMWDETAPIHERARFDELLAAVAAPDFSTFDAVERKLFARMGLAGTRVAQLSCNNARELIAVKKAGAGRCVGFDISEKFIDQGRRLAVAAGVEIELLRANVYEIPSSFDAAFDLVYVTIGALGWLPDARAFLDVATRLLRPGGQLFLYEMHPVLNVFDEQHLTPAAPLVARSYFAREPTYGEALPDYFDKTQLVHSPSYWFHHPLGTIVGGVLAAGLSLSHFEEYPHDLSGVYAALEGSPHSLPMSFSLIAKK